MHTDGEQTAPADRRPPFTAPRRALGFPRPRAPDTVLKTTLPETLRKLRGLRGISQATLSRRSGVAASTIAAIETGLARDVMLSTLNKLCGVLAVTPDYLLGVYANETYAARAPDATAPDVRDARTCRHCERALRRGEPHPPGECLMLADRRGGSTPEHRAYLAAAFGFGVQAIDAICADENGRLSDGRLLWPLRGR